MLMRYIKESLSICLLFTCFMSFSYKNKIQAEPEIDFFKWDSPDYSENLTSEVIFKFGRLYYALKGQRLFYTNRDFIKDLKKIGFSDTEINNFEELKIMQYMDSYVKEIKVQESKIDFNSVFYD